MKRLSFSVLVLSMLVANQRGLVAQTRLADGVIRYDKSTGASFWQYIQQNWGWVVKSQPFGRSVAFLVGVGDYAYINPKLRYVGSDLKELREFLLIDAGFDTVYVVQDSVATADLVDHYMFNEF